MFRYIFKRFSNRFLVSTAPTDSSVVTFNTKNLRTYLLRYHLFQLLQVYPIIANYQMVSYYRFCSTLLNVCR